MNKQTRRIIFACLIALALALSACQREEQAASFGASGYQWQYNEVGWERMRGNTEVTLLTSDGRITTTNTSAQTNYNHRGLILFVDVTGRDGSTTLTPAIQVQEPIGDNWITAWTAAAAINSADTTLAYTFYPVPSTDAASLYTEEVELLVSRTWRAVMTHSDTDPITYTASCSMIR